jgi:hypothetical protein
MPAQEPTAARPAAASAEIHPALESFIVHLRFPASGDELS